MATRALVAPSDRAQHTKVAASKPTTQTAQPKRLAEVCSPWSGRQAPCSRHEEADLVRELTELVGDDEVTDFERRDVTVLITALRCGLSLPEVRAQAPGITPARLLAGHRELERRRAHAEAAWHALEADPTLDGLRRHGGAAAKLLPAVLTQLMAFVDDEERLGLEIARASDQIERTSRRVLLLEDRVAGSTDDPDRARELGTLLYDVYGHGAWSLETFLPPRVGTLVPLRLAALLGEDITASRRVS